MSDLSERITSSLRWLVYFHGEDPPHLVGRMDFGNGFPPLPVTCQECGTTIRLFKDLDFEFWDKEDNRVDLTSLIQDDDTQGDAT